jgi:N-glycosylase/DNA lyase
MSDWFTLHLSTPIPSPTILAEILDGGQSFAWQNTGPDTWRGHWLDYAFEVCWQSPSSLSVQALTPSSIQSPGVLPHYLGEGINWESLVDNLPWRSDPVLGQAIARFKGLRILRQPVEEALLGFLCSSLKSIPQIKIILTNLSRKRGQALPGTNLFSFPSWDVLAETPDSILRECGLGYRARHIANCARELSLQPAFFDQLRTLSYSHAHASLAELPGVGPKIADCVCLFGLAHWQAFPIDSWIQKVLTVGYGLTGWTPAQCQQFAQAHFGTAAGLAQQFLFSDWRRGRKG